MQRSWGRTGPGVWEEQEGDPCGWSRVSNGEREVGGQGGDRRMVQCVVDCGRTLALTLSEVGASGTGCKWGSADTLAMLPVRLPAPWFTTLCPPYFLLW